LWRERVLGYYIMREGGQPGSLVSGENGVSQETDGMLSGAFIIGCSILVAGTSRVLGLSMDGKTGQ
jgi:hypothetical protein